MKFKCSDIVRRTLRPDGPVVVVSHGRKVVPQQPKAKSAEVKVQRPTLANFGLSEMNDALLQ